MKAYKLPVYIEVVYLWHNIFGPQIGAVYNLDADSVIKKQLHGI
jgi:hypothetical protein